MPRVISPLTLTVIFTIIALLSVSAAPLSDTSGSSLMPDDDGTSCIPSSKLSFAPSSTVVVAFPLVTMPTSHVDPSYPSASKIDDASDIHINRCTGSCPTMTDEQTLSTSQDEYHYNDDDDNNTQGEWRSDDGDTYYYWNGVGNVAFAEEAEAEWKTACLEEDDMPGCSKQDFDYAAWRKGRRLVDLGQWAEWCARHVDWDDCRKDSSHDLSSVARYNMANSRYTMEDTEFCLRHQELAWCDMEYKAKSRAGRSTFCAWYPRVDGCDVGEMVGVGRITPSIDAPVGGDW